MFVITGIQFIESGIFLTHQTYINSTICYEKGRSSIAVFLLALLVNTHYVVLIFSDGNRVHYFLDPRSN